MDGKTYLYHQKKRIGMKKYIRMLSVMMVGLMLSGAAVSCDEDDWDEAYLEGQWVSTDEPGNEIYLVFNQYPKRGTYYMYENGYFSHGESFAWDVANKKIWVTYNNGDIDKWYFRQYGNNRLEVDFGNGRVPFVRTSSYPSDEMLPYSYRSLKATGADSLEVHGKMPSQNAQKE